MDKVPFTEVSLTAEQRLAEVASRMQLQRTGHAPQSVTVMLSEDTLVVTLHEALTPAEKALANSSVGAAQVQEFHRQLFANSMNEMRREIKRLTGREVREAAAEIETATGTVVHAFTTGAMVQVFLLAPSPHRDANSGGDPDGISRADDDGFRVEPEAGSQKNSSPSVRLKG